MISPFQKKLPWRFQSKVNFLNAHSNFVFRKIKHTRPIACKQNAEVAYISLLCHRDVAIGLMAIKSFLRFCNNVRVVIQDDGSLTDQDKTILMDHIPGLRIIERTEADRRITGKISDEIYKARNQDPSFLKLVDTNLLFDGPRIIADSDILFRACPDEILTWILSDSSSRQPFFHEVNNANKAFETNLDAINRELNTNIGKLDYCSGFIGFSESVATQEIEKVFSVLSRFSQVWGLEQNIFAFLLKEKSFKLNPKFYLAILDEVNRTVIDQAKMIHFVGKFKHSHYYREGQNIISSLILS